jgi:hypothetical protein
MKSRSSQGEVPRDWLLVWAAPPGAIKLLGQLK